MSRYTNIEYHSNSYPNKWKIVFLFPSTFSTLTSSLKVCHTEMSAEVLVTFSNMLLH